MANYCASSRVKGSSKDVKLLRGGKQRKENLLHFPAVLFP